MSKKEYILVGFMVVVLVSMGLFSLLRRTNSAGESVLATADSVQSEDVLEKEATAAGDAAGTTEIDETKGTMNQAASYKRYTSAPNMVLERGKKYSAVLKTSEGDITVRLFQDEAPVAVNNFVFLAKDGFYNNTIFHRTIKDFMIQGGDPLGNGTGGPGYKFADEPITRDYKRGTLAMANSGPNTNGSQFFIMHNDYPLPKNYVIFGEVSSGIEVVDAIAQAPTFANAFGERSQPVNPASILSIEVSDSSL